jgi:hypothetical protein
MVHRPVALRGGAVLVGSSTDSLFRIIFAFDLRAVVLPWSFLEKWLSIFS